MAVRPRGPTQSSIDLPSYFSKRLGFLGVLLSDVARFAPVVFYFWAYWNNKEVIRRSVRTGALWFLSASSYVLLAEVSVELSGRRLTPLLRRHDVEVGAIIGFTLCIGVLLFHHRNELRHRHAHFVLAERLWEFLIRRDATTWDESIETATRLFRDIYTRFGIAHVSVALPVNGELVIQPNHVFPAESRQSFFQRLPLDDGVAGYVYKDGKARYVPRLFYPYNGYKRYPLQLFFPHALVFEIGQDSFGRFEVVRPKLDFDVFKTTFGEPFVFKSFVSVPIRARGRNEVIGVLNFDFTTTDPLIRVDIKTAVILGSVLAEELERIRSKALPAA